MIKDKSLYLVISEEYGKSRSAVEIAQGAIKGGVDMIQMREKSRPRSELLELGKKLSRLCKENGVKFIVNDDPDIARQTDASGVHLGQDDILKHPVEGVRELLGRDKLIGVSTHSPEEFRRANGLDVDYIAFGPIFKTKTKDYFIGSNDIGPVVSIARKPVFFIGGIDLSNIGDVLNKGAKNIALIRAITEAEDIASKTREFKERIMTHDTKDKR